MAHGKEDLKQGRYRAQSVPSASVRSILDLLESYLSSVGRCRSAVANNLRKLLWLTCLFQFPSWRSCHSSSFCPLWWHRCVHEDSSLLPVAACCKQCPFHLFSCFAGAPIQHILCCCLDQRSTEVSAAAGGRWCARRLSGWFGVPRHAQSHVSVRYSSARCRESDQSVLRQLVPASDQSLIQCCKAHSAASEARWEEVRQ